MSRSGESGWISPYLADDFQIRFRASMNKSDEDANVDNVQIVTSGTSSASAMATDLALLAWVDLDSSDDDNTVAEPHWSLARLVGL